MHSDLPACMASHQWLGLANKSVEVDEEEGGVEEGGRGGRRGILQSSRRYCYTLRMVYFAKHNPETVAGC